MGASTSTPLLPLDVSVMVRSDTPMAAPMPVPLEPTETIVPVKVVM